MSRSSIILAVLAIVSIVILALLPTQTPEHLKIEKNRVLTGSELSIPNIERAAFDRLNPGQREEMRLLYSSIGENNKLNLEIYEQIAQKWFTFAAPEMSGIFAEKIADVEPSDTSWTIAGTTFFLAAKKSEDERLQDFCVEKARKAFDFAISLAPKNVDHRINRAQVDIDFPVKDQPMKGVQRLLALNKKYPDNSKVLIRLAELGMQTGQWEKAKGRLEKLIEWEPNHEKAHCLLAEVLMQLNEPLKAEQAKINCQNLNN